LDERRAKFKENAWNQPTSYEAQLSDTDRPDHEHHGNHEDSRHSAHHLKLMQAERHYSEVYDSPTDVDEVSL
jgi:hypothetical protein